MTDMMQFVWVAIGIAGWKSFANKVSIVVVHPFAVIGEFVFEPSVAPDAVIAPVNVGTD